MTAYSSAKRNLQLLRSFSILRSYGPATTECMATISNSICSLFYGNVELRLETEILTSLTAIGQLQDVTASLSLQTSQTVNVTSSWLIRFYGFKRRWQRPQKSYVLTYLN